MKKLTAEAQWTTARTNAISFMLDNPNSIGIFPTSECFKKLDEAVKQFASQEVAGRNTEIEIMLRTALEASKTNGHYKDGVMSPSSAVHHAISNLIVAMQPLPQPPTPKEKEESRR